MRWFSTVFTLESGSNAVAVKGETFLVAHGQRPHFLNVPDISQTLFRIFLNIFFDDDVVVLLVADDAGDKRERGGGKKG